MRYFDVLMISVAILGQFVETHCMLASRRPSLNQSRRRAELNPVARRPLDVLFDSAHKSGASPVGTLFSALAALAINDDSLTSGMLAC